MKTTFLALLICVTCVSRELRAVEPIERDVEYAQIGEKRLLLDFYRAANSTQAKSPLVIWVHGGAWRSGSKESVPVTQWLESGYSIASVNYRLSPEAKFPAQVFDIKAAIRYLRANAEKYSVNSDCFVIAGSSAGGHLAALVGVSSGVKELEGEIGENLKVRSNVQAVVSFFGASNLQSILGQSTEYGLGVRKPALQLLLGGQPTEVPDLAKLASPVTHVDASDPPLWLIHGDADPQMPLEQSKELYQAFKQVGIPVELDVIPNGKHGGDEFFNINRLDELAQKLHKLFASDR